MFFTFTLLWERWKYYTIVFLWARIESLWTYSIFTLCNSTYCPVLCGPQSQLDAMKLNRLHAATMAPTPSHIKTREENWEVRPHQRARRSSSDDNSRPKSAISENRITTIPEITESFERRLCLRDKKTMPLVRRSVMKFLQFSPVCCRSSSSLSQRSPYRFKIT